jgi:hypothetical protein
MAHWQQTKFVSLVHQHFLAGLYGAVLEIGSYSVNGSVRAIFNDWSYVGADLVEGPWVDVMCPGHELSYGDKSFDVVLSCECFEHDKSWKATFTNMHRMARNLVVMTCASTGRLEHGTRRSSPGSSPGTGDSDYYRNLTEKDFAAFDLKTMFTTWVFFYAPYANDLYFVGWKAKAPNLEKFRTAVASEIVRKDCRPLLRRLFYSPLTFASKMMHDEAFQTFALWYMRLRRAFK